ncbi:glycosyltransferase family 4 protein [Halorientalis brevis]|uniref:Glycosyltransferase family 4 protein n=1 Tax=Halorientalis brevis TaxID=1126241 RepID=A0ABD6C7U9_9EURY|nr:glycosyltransferase family 1 protein [Halorientalis brevis]
MSKRVGIVTNPLDHGMAGNMTNMRICRELKRRTIDDLEFVYIHTDQSDLDLYNNVDEAIVPRAPILFLREVAKLDLDLIYYPQFPWLRPGFFLTDTKKVVRLYGDLPFTCPSYVSWQSRMKKYAYAAFYRKTGLANRVDQYVIPSGSLRQSKRRSLDISDEKFTTVPLAHGMTFDKINDKEIEEILNSFNLKEGYILDVASTNKIKNVSSLIRGVYQLQERGIDAPHLVIAGDWLGSDVSDLGRELLGDGITFTGYLEAEELKALYKGAKLYVNTSLHETFGITNLEAMEAGLPVITSDKYAIPEVVGDAAYFLEDPEDPKEIADAIEHFLCNEEIREEYIEKGKNRADKYSWKRTVDELLDVFYSVL